MSESFDAAPDSTSWSTANMPGSGADILDSGSLDFGVNNFTASSIIDPLLPVTTQAQVAEWKFNSIDHDIQSRPTGDAFHLLMATLQNGTGRPVTGFSITYGYATANPPGQFEELPGLHVYYSLTGDFSTWTPIDALTVDTVMTFPTFEDVTANVTLPSPVPNNGQFFILWADDNGNGFTDPSYHMDNVRMSVVPEPSTILLGLGGTALIGLFRRRAG